MAEQLGDASGTAARVALVMAASRGLGRACAEALARGGHRLVVCARNPDGVDETVAALGAIGAEAVGVQADVALPQELEAVFQKADKAFGRLDVLVANAGGPPPGGFMDASDHQWQLAFELTLMSAVRATRLAIPRMRRNRYGRIVVIGSSSVKQPIDNLVLSNVFRPALLGMIKTVAREVAQDGITANIVSPGRIDTDRVRTLDEHRAKAQGTSYEEVRQSSERSIPAQRYGKPEDVGAVVAFLASEAAGYVTGQSVLVDGGMVSALP